MQILKRFYENDLCLKKTTTDNPFQNHAIRPKVGTDLHSGMGKCYEKLVSLFQALLGCATLVNFNLTKIRSSQFTLLKFDSGIY